MALIGKVPSFFGWLAATSRVGRSTGVLHRATPGNQQPKRPALATGVGRSTGGVAPCNTRDAEADASPFRCCTVSGRAERSWLSTLKGLYAP